MIRLRFAPSPTGVLHIGGARTALYNWLLARGSGGTLILRIEDTDAERSTPENVEQIIDALTWLELDWDEGPVSQASRAERHAERLAELLDSGAAYYDEGAVRLRVPDEGETVVEDVIRGPISFPNASFDDFVIARSDGSVLYNFAVAVDDAEMAITDVVRGDDHLSNTPKQLHVLRALGVEPPRYAHLPLLHGPDGKKLSKRHGAASVQELREAGYLPEAVRNYLALLGWGAADDATLISTEELIQQFDLARVGRSAAIFDEPKLRWMNGRYMRELSLDRYVEAVARHVGREPDETLRAGCAIAQEKAQTLAEVWPLIRYLFEEPQDIDDPDAWRKVMTKGEGVGEILAAALEALRDVDPFEPEAIEVALAPVVEATGGKAGKVFQPIRVAITGTTVSPGIFESLAVLGREKSLQRIEAAIKRLAL